MVSSDLTFIKKSILLRSSLFFEKWLRYMDVSVMSGKSLGLGGCSCGLLLYGLLVGKCVFVVVEGIK